MNKMKRILSIFLSFFKIGLFTFGGGYAMVAVIERELVEKKKWISSDDFLDIIAIAESSPGPLAVNSATFVGYKTCGFIGSLMATVGVILPSFAIIFIISLFFEKFLTFKIVEYAFKGIQSCVAFLIVSAGLKFLKQLDRSIFNYIIFGVTAAIMIIFSLFSVNYSSVWLILAGATVGVFTYLGKLLFLKRKNKKGKTDFADTAISKNDIEKKEKPL